MAILLPHFFCIIAFCFWLSSCSSQKQTSNYTRPVTNGPTRSIADSETKLLSLINTQRKKKLASQLVSDPRIKLAALDHSTSMNKHHFFSHKGIDGKNFKVRMERRGYPLSHASENIAEALSAEQAFQLWMKSSGHRKNMLNRKYKKIGISRVGNFWTANFAANPGR